MRRLPLALLLLAAAAARADRVTYNFNQGWEFFRPAEAAAFVPAADRLVARGEFPAGTAARDVTFPPRTARHVCLVADSSHQGPFASVAEFHLLDADGQPLPRDGWRVAYADSEEPAADDVAAAALDGRADTKWHSAWKITAPPPPHSLVIDLGAPRSFAGFRYLPRHDGNTSGQIRGWRFYAAADPFPVPAPRAADRPPADAAWEAVNLPHSVRLEPLNASGGRNYQGVCWYRKAFAAPADWADRVVHLECEGAMQVAELWLNGQPLGTNYGGYLPFTLDLTGRVRPGATNVLLVKLDNSDNPEVPPGKPQAQLDFTYFGGLYRDVRVVALERLHITDEILADRVAGGGILVTYPEVAAARARVAVRTEVANRHAAARTCAVRQELVDAAGAVAAAHEAPLVLAAGGTGVVTQELAVAAPRLWHPYHPDLYTLRTTVLEGGRAADRRTTRVGLRDIRFTPRGLFINGGKFFASGVNRHQDHPYVGYALPDSAHVRDARKIRDAGFTSVRTHYPQDPAFMDACDELGLVCIVANPGWQFFGNERFVARTIDNARRMVRRDRNHACAFLWEPTLNETAAPESHVRAVHEAVHEEYPGSPCFTAGDGPHGGREILDVVYGRELAADDPTWAREWGDSVDNWGDQQGRVRVARGWGELPLLVQLQNHILKYDDLLRTTGGGPAATGLAGAGLWAGIDCYRGYHHQPFHGGPLDLFRLPKFSHYFFQSQRSPDPAVDRVAGGPMIFIASYGSAWSPSRVTVLSNCEEVRLFENGREVAVRKPDAGHALAHPPFTFETRKADEEKTTYYMTNAEPGYHYRPSEYRAEGLIGGRVVAEHTVKAPGVMRHLTLEADLMGRELAADGADWVRVYARVCDGRGTVHPLADELVTFAVEGEGSVVGDASIGTNPVRAEAGIATALIRATRTAGDLTVRATAFGLAPAELRLRSSPVTGPQL